MFHRFHSSCTILAQQLGWKQVHVGVSTVSFPLVLEVKHHLQESMLISLTSADIRESVCQTGLQQNCSAWSDAVMTCWCSGEEDAWRTKSTMLEMSTVDDMERQTRRTHDCAASGCQRVIINVSGQRYETQLRTVVLPWDRHSWGPSPGSPTRCSAARRSDVASGTRVATRSSSTDIVQRSRYRIDDSQRCVDNLTLFTPVKILYLHLRWPRLEESTTAQESKTALDSSLYGIFASLKLFESYSC